VPGKKPAKKYTARADLGKSIDPFFAKQPPVLRAILDELRALLRDAVPAAAGSIKWGMPFFTLDGEMMCAFGAHKSHVNLILAGPPSSFADPKGLLEGEGKTGRHLEIASADQIPRAQVKAWMKTAAKNARAK
jgi:hypothetical protein